MPIFDPPQELHNHVIIAGYGRAGQLIGQLLSENLIPFVALDVSNERVAAGKVRLLGFGFVFSAANFAFSAVSFAVLVCFGMLGLRGFGAAQGCEVFGGACVRAACAGVQL